MKLPEIIEGLIKAQNELNSDAFANHFTENAKVFDEGASYSGREQIRQWIQQAAEKYSMHLKPISYNQTGTKGKLAVEVTGTFNGSPAVMQYHLEMSEGLLSTLKITG